MLFGRRERTIRRIMVVEDEPLVAFDLEHALADDGYEVVATVDSLEDAARVIAAERLDLVITDIRLAGDGDGTDVARAAARAEVPVLFVTGNCPEEARRLAVGCLAKPYTARMLKAALDALNDHRAGRKVKKLPAGLSLYESAASI